MVGLKAVTKKRLADIDTPVSAFMKLCQGERDSFLFESGEAVEDLGRYSIVAWDPICLAETQAQPGRAHPGAERTSSHPAREFFDLARRATADLECEDLPELPFVGSLVGYVGYDAVRLMERLPPAKDQDLPIAELCYPSRFVVFDHLYRMMTLVAIAERRGHGQGQAQGDGRQRLGHPLSINGRAARFEVKKPPKDRYVQAVLPRPRNTSWTGTSSRWFCPINSPAKPIWTPSTSTAGSGSKIPRPTCSSSISGTASWWGPRPRPW